MAHLGEEDYWGGRFQKIIGPPDSKLTLRSVKVFLDGPSSLFTAVTFLRDLLFKVHLGQEGLLS